jgi:hypothetical protein
MRYAPGPSHSGTDPKLAEPAWPHSMSNIITVFKLRVVQIGVRVRVHPWVVLAQQESGSEWVLRDEKRQMRYLISKVSVLKRRREHAGGAHMLPGYRGGWRRWVYGSRIATISDLDC